MPATADTTKRPRGRKPSTWVAPVLFIVGGVAFSGAYYARGHHSDAVSTLVVVVLLAAALALLGDRSETAVLFREVDGDERTQHITTRALATTGGLLCLVLPVGLFVQTVRGVDTAPWSWLCCFSGTSFVVSLAVLKRRS